jgi:hypothetical protein
MSIASGLAWDIVVVAKGRGFHRVPCLPAIAHEPLEHFDPVRPSYRRRRCELKRRSACAGVKVENWPDRFRCVGGETPWSLRVTC